MVKHQDKKNYINYMQTARDTYNQLEYAKKKGREEGRVEGREEGLQEGLQQGHVDGQNEERILIATKMLQMKLPVQSICEATGLSAEEITKLQNEP